MKHILEGLTFMLIGAVIAISGNLLNYADICGEVTVFDEIHCRKIVLEMPPEKASIILAVDDGTPSITMQDEYGGIFSVKAGADVDMFLRQNDRDTGTTTSEIRFTAGKNNTGITHFVKQQ